MSIHERWLAVQQKIKAACARSGRHHDDVKVIAVTKYVSAEVIIEAVQAGLQHIGENKVQDVQKKWEQISPPQGVWHFIGHLQSNKVKYMIDKCTFVHSLDRLSLAKELNKQGARFDQHMSCFVQVNVSGEQSKHGLSIEQVEPFIRQLAAYPRLNIIGLMTMAPLEENAENTRPIFRQLKQLQLELQQLQLPHAPLTECSMGMSNDFEVAIEEGATYVRLGSALVGRSAILDGKEHG